MFVTGAVRVEVPATSANLGPGFDSLGLALEMRDVLEAQVVDDGLVIDVSGAGADAVPRDESHLVVRAMRAGFDALGAEPAGLRLSCANVIPHARGLGSSSAAIVGGIALARALVLDGRDRMDDAALLDLAADLEGHPDNVAPAAYGGFVVAGRESERWYAVRAPVAPEVRAEVFVPPDPVATAVARGLLPDTISHQDAAANAGRAALLVAALGHEPARLWEGTRDYVHQEFRRPAMPASVDLVDALRADGHAAVISGAGPTVLVLTAHGEDLGARCPSGWVHHRLTVAARGVTSAPRR
jgi:homoserine kinase